MRFTDAKIKGLKPQKERYELWQNDGRGFGVRVAPTGRKTWIYMYRFEGRARRLTLGTYPAISLADAHTRHATARLELEKGVDPGAKEVESNRQLRLTPTMKLLSEEYIEKWSKARKRTWQEDQRIINKDILPGFGHRKARNITRREVITLLDKIVDRGAPISANRTLALLSSIFNFAVKRDIVPANPCSRITPPGKETQRERVLSEKEMRALWLGLKDAQMQEPTKAAIRLMMLTAQRKGEVVGATWEEFDLKKGWWTIPAERAKNGLAHRVPLTDMALEILNDLSELTGGYKWLFPSPSKESHITPRAASRALLRSAEGIKVKDFGPHDLRRSAASYMTGAGIPRLVVKKVLNHIEADITAVYDRHSYDSEKRLAMETWERTLRAIIEGKKQEGDVIPITAKKA